VDHLLLNCDVSYAIWIAFLVVLDYLGLCLVVLSICMLVGGPLVVRGVLLCGR
jgi:hypothetical protein